MADAAPAADAHKYLSVFARLRYRRPFVWARGIGSGRRRQQTGLNDLTSAGAAPTGGVIRFRLDGKSRAYDPARQAIRPDLADVAEAATHFAPHYAAAMPVVAQRETAVRERNAADANARTTLPANGAFHLLDLTGDWAWGYTADGHVVGYVAVADLVLGGEGA